MQHTSPNARHDWVGKVIHWELCKRLKFDHTSKYSILKQESFQDNLMDKILWNLYTNRSPNLGQKTWSTVNLHQVNFAISVDNRVEIKGRKKTDKYLDLAWEQKQNVEYESDSFLEQSSKSWKKTEGIGNQKKNWGYSDQSIVKIG